MRRLAIGIAAAIGFALWSGDRVGFEGDDLAIIEGAAHFDFKPRDALYRFAWQPLSYLLAHWLTQLGMAPLSLTYVGNIFGAVGLVLLAEALRGVLRIPGRTCLAYALVLAVPELWITILYFNTTAVGLPFFCGSLLFACAETRDERARLLNIGAAAVLHALACGFRLDFAAATPALLLLVFCRTPARKWLAVSVFVLVAAASALAICAALRLGPSDFLQIVGGFETHPWAAWRSAVLLVLALLPLALMSPLLVSEIMKQPWPRQPLLFWGALVICALPMLYPLKALYSAKYLVPACCVGLVGLAFLLRETTALARVTVWGIVAVLVMSYTLGLRLQDRRLAGISLNASTFATHDGPRPYGGYVAFLGMMRDPEKRRQPRGDYLVLVRALADWFVRAPEDATAILYYDDSDSRAVNMLVDEWSWGWPALFLYNHGWALDAYAFRRRMALHAPDGRRAEIVTRRTSARGAISSPCFIEIGPLPTSEDETERYLRMISRASCRP